MHAPPIKIFHYDSDTSVRERRGHVIPDTLTLLCVALNLRFEVGLDFRGLAWSLG